MQRPDEHNELTDLAYPPAGGSGKLAMLGILLPLALLWYAGNIWTEQAVEIYGRHRSHETIQGEAARWMAGGWVGVALLCHVRWFWGLRGFYRTFEIGTAAAILVILGGCGTGFFKAML